MWRYSFLSGTFSLAIAFDSRPFSLVQVASFASLVLVIFALTFRRF